MNENLKSAKRHIRTFLRGSYGDEHLAMLLAHMRDGKFAYESCCCFVGVVTADHALRGLTKDYRLSKHYTDARFLPHADTAEAGVWALGFVDAERVELDMGDDPLRRRRLISLVKAEMRYRDRLAAQERITELVEIGYVHQ